MLRYVISVFNFHVILVILSFKNYGTLHIASIKLVIAAISGEFNKVELKH